jgi:hypothetical protein
MPRKIWKYRLAQPATYKARQPPDFSFSQYNAEFFADSAGRLWLSIDDKGTITIEGGYAWDGCSPKWSVFGHIIGTPDGAPNPLTGFPRTYFASLVHDALCQFADDPAMPFTRAQIDRIFYDILLEDGWSAAWLYYAGVRVYSRWEQFWREFPLRVGLK